MANNIQIGADTSGFVAGVNRATQSMRGLGQGIAAATSGSPFAGIISALPSILTFTSVLAAAKKFATEFYSALEAGGALVDLAGQTGVAVDKLMVLQEAFKQAGLGAEQLQPMLAKMQKAVTEAASGAPDATQNFQYLGLSADELSGMTADQQLLKIGDALKDIKNPAERSAAAMEIFGRGGAKMLSYFAAGGLDDVKKGLGGQAEMMLENAGIFDRASDVLGTAHNKIQGFFVGVASGLMPQIMGLIDSLNGIDLSGIGKAFGDSLSFWINYFRNFGTEGELIYNTLKLAFAQAVNFLGEEMRVLIAQIGASFSNVFKGPKKQEEAIKQAEIEARAKGPTMDTTEIEAAIERDMKKIEESTQATKDKALEDYGTPDEGDGSGGILKKRKASGGGAAVGMPDISSLQKVGGGSSLLTPGQDNSPAYQSVRIQEDIRDYIKTLIDVVKQGGENFDISNAPTGLVLTA